MIYVGSCDTEDWSNGWWQISFVLQKYILQYSKIENHYFKLNNISQYYYFFPVFLIE